MLILIIDFDYVTGCIQNCCRISAGLATLHNLVGIKKPRIQNSGYFLAPSLKIVCTRLHASLVILAQFTENAPF